MSGLIPSSGSPFDAIRHVDENGNEYWLARELMIVLGYAKWQHFGKNIKKGVVSCKNTGNVVTEHFLPSPVTTQSGREMEDWKLSRYGSYLVSMNCDPEKKEVAEAQSYFAIRTHQAEQIQAQPQVESDAILLALETAAVVRRKQLEHERQLKAQQDSIAELEAKAQAYERLIEKQQKLIAANQDNITDINAELGRYSDPTGKFYTILGYASLIRVHVGFEEAKALGRTASAYCRANGLSKETIHDARFGKVGNYPIEALNHAFKMRGLTA